MSINRFHPCRRDHLLRIEECSQALRPVEAGIEQGPVQHNDESGLRMEGSNHWVHVAATKSLTCYFVHKKRGRKALEELGTLNGYNGAAWHPARNPPGI